MQGLLSDVKLFTDDTSLFSVINCVKASTLVLTGDLLQMLDWAYQWEMLFNPDQGKQVLEVIFLRKN